MFSEHIDESRINTALGWKLRLARQKREITQAALGKVVGRDQAFISRVESGCLEISAKQLFVIVNYLALSYEEFNPLVPDAAWSKPLLTRDLFK